MAVPNITELQVGEVCVIPGPLKGHDFTGVGYVKRPQDEGLEDAENDNVGSNAKREGGYGGDGKAWGAEHLANCKSQILHHRLHSKRHRLVALLPQLRHIAELPHRCLTRGLGSHPAGDKLLRRLGAMKSHFFVQFIEELPAP